jgi:hypothetical protein
MQVRSGLVAASLGAVLFVAQAGAGETPKNGGTLTYMIPADAPPSLDGHRETTYATVHPINGVEVDSVSATGSDTWGSSERRFSGT